MTISRILLLLFMTACAAQPASTHQDKAGRLHVKGPMKSVGPFTSIDEVEEALCPIIMKMPGAKNGDEGIEYCGLIYRSPSGWHSTELAYVPLQRKGDVRRCRLPDVIDDAQFPTGLVVTIGDFHSHPWPDTEFSEARLVQGRLRGDLMPMPGHQTELSVAGETYPYRRVMFSTRCDHYRYLPASKEIFKHNHENQQWDKIADVATATDKQTGKIIRGSAKMLPGKSW